MTLRSGKEVEGLKLADPKSKSEEKIEKEIKEEGHIHEDAKVTLTPSIPIKSSLSPFPCREEGGHIHKDAKVTLTPSISTKFN